MSVVEFPKRITRSGPKEQWDAVQNTKQSEVLNAILLKVGPITLTADEILKGRERESCRASYVREENGWRIDPGPVKGGTQ